ncbi:MAG: hypothetical protein D6741_21910, partial [Planctomycetota bacterium]
MTTSSSGKRSDARHPSVDIAELTAKIKAEAIRLGFDAVGVCRAGRANTLEALDAWLASGYNAGMAYLARRREAYEHPEHVLPGCRS